MKKYKWVIVDTITIILIVAIAMIFVAIGKWDWKWCSIFFLISYFFNTIFVIFSVANFDNPAEKLSWIFFIITIPAVGLVFYSLFRIRKQIGNDVSIYNKNFENFLINKYNEDINFDNYNHQIIKWQTSLVKRNFYYTNLSTFQHGYDAYEELLKDIKKAKKYIHIEMYILKESEIYEKIKEILFQKIKENVEIKIIFDKFGSWKVPIDEFKHLEKNGIDFCFFNIPYYPYVRTGDNQRLHRKFFIIDGEVVHFGGLNISDEYCSFSKKYGYWADLNFKATGRIINDYESIFIYDWNRCKKEKLNIAKYKNDEKIKDFNNIMLTFNEGPDIRQSYLEDSIDYWINQSTKNIKIATPYFIPSKKILNSLKNAISRGVEIDICIPGKPDKKFTYKATLFYSNELAKLGANIYIFNETFIHSKFGIFDDKFTYIGTNNLDIRSFYSNYESINVVFGKNIVEELNNVFDSYKRISNKSNFNKNNSFRYKFRLFLFSLLSPLM